jgi:mono/diheme cytochrome c family protein
MTWVPFVTARAPAFLALVLAGTGPAGAQNPSAQPPPPNNSQSANTQNQQGNNSKNEQSLIAQGEKVYMDARCYACHGQFGFGGAGPRFREDRFLGLTDYVVGQIILGRDIMPAFGDTLNDQQIAAVATYIRKSWGNNFGAVQPQEVAQLRNDVKLHPQEGEAHLSGATSSGPAPQPPGPGTTTGQQGSPSNEK